MNGRANPPTSYPPRRERTAAGQSSPALSCASARPRWAGLALILNACIALSACGGAGTGAGGQASSQTPPVRSGSVRVAQAKSARPARGPLASHPLGPRAAPVSCASPSAQARITSAVVAAERRYGQEQHGLAIHTDLRHIAADQRLVRALAAHDPSAAQAAADGQLVNHVVRIRVLQGSRTLADANPTSFDVAGAARDIRAPDGRLLGKLRITIQDVIGFIKLVRRHDGADVALIRASRGQVRASLPAATLSPLPRAGCVSLAGRRYVVRAFTEPSFTGEALTIWLLVSNPIIR